MNPLFRLTARRFSVVLVFAFILGCSEETVIPLDEGPSLPDISGCWMMKANGPDRQMIISDELSITIMDGGGEYMARDIDHSTEGLRFRVVWREGRISHFNLDEATAERMSGKEFLGETEQTLIVHPCG